MQNRRRYDDIATRNLRMLIRHSGASKSRVAERQNLAAD